MQLILPIATSSGHRTTNAQIVGPSVSQRKARAKLHKQIPLSSVGGAVLALVVGLGVGCDSRSSQGSASFEFHNTNVVPPIAVKGFRIYEEPPAEFEVIGHLTFEGDKDSATEQLKMMFGSMGLMGANGLIFTAEDESSGGGMVIKMSFNPAPGKNVERVYAKLIRVTKEKK